MQYQFSELKEKFKNLPDDIQDAISSVSVGNTMEEIGKKNRLHIDQMNELYDETGLVMLGFTHPKDYIRNLQKRLTIDVDIAKKIAMDVNEQIFRPIRESLKQIHNVSDENQESRIKNQEKSEQGVLQPTPASPSEAGRATYNLQPKQEDHPISRLKKTSEEARALLNKNLESGIKNQEKSEQQSLQPTTYNLQPKDEHPILRLKKEVPKQFSGDRGKIIGWPVKKEELRSMNHESRDATLSDKTEKPFFKITPGDTKHEARNMKHETNGGRLMSANWSPAQPEKEAPAPENLPVETEKDEAPPVGAYPPLLNKNQESKDVNQEVRIPKPSIDGGAGKNQEAIQPKPTSSTEYPNAIRQAPQQSSGQATKLGEIIHGGKTLAKSSSPANDINKKLSEPFRMPRAETEYKEKTPPSMPKKEYEGGDPYREPVD